MKVGLNYIKRSCGGFASFFSLGLFFPFTMYFHLRFEVLALKFVQRASKEDVINLPVGHYGCSVIRKAASFKKRGELIIKSIFLYLYLIYLRIPQQGSNPDRGGLLSSYKRK